MNRFFTVLLCAALVGCGIWICTLNGANHGIALEKADLARQYAVLQSLYVQAKDDLDQLQTAHDADVETLRREADQWKAALGLIDPAPAAEDEAEAEAAAAPALDDEPSEAAIDPLAQFVFTVPDAQEEETEEAAGPIPEEDDADSVLSEPLFPRHETEEAEDPDEAPDVEDVFPLDDDDVLPVG
ncbi:MAG: hypothetical protein IJ662_00180 [Clostridia bacterium]|nr:hypothetical protein [Clostridia bacterium]